jgi:hypothetical protein
MTTRTEFQQQITKEATGLLRGKTVKAVRFLTKEESDDHMWHRAAPVIEFDDGTILFPSRDPEGNGAGALFGRLSDGTDIGLPCV